jgi:hypothetical protein
MPYKEAVRLPHSVYRVGVLSIRTEHMLFPGLPTVLKTGQDLKEVDTKFTVF